ncbi:MAG TPA: long-chain fatty acid--CoA ligase [Spirochaetota bacterium]|nr:long-chain fatty acid--CoA ligase [Spirochaetota bacterium]
MYFDDYQSLPQIFFLNAEKNPDKPLLSVKVKGQYKDIKWDTVKEEVYVIASYLASRGVSKGTKVAVYSENRPEWWVYDLAVLSLGAITVPLHAVSAVGTVELILHKSGAQVCFVDTEERLNTLQLMSRKLPLLKEYIMFDKIETKKKNIKYYGDLIEKKLKPADYKRVDAAVKKVKREFTATLIFTSGTTGEPKGVELTQHNFLSNTGQIEEAMGKYLDETDAFLSFLPLSHVLERTAGYYYPMTTCKKVYFAESITTIQQDLVATRPTILVSVPRIYEKMHSAIVGKVTKASPVKKAVFKFSVAMGQKAVPYHCKKKPLPFYLKKPHAIAEKLVLSKLRVALGMDNLKFAISGGGPIAYSDMTFFVGMGVTVLEGFGLTETSPVTNLVLPDDMKLGSVGKPFKNTKIKISDEGEILIKGPQVMKGYYRNAKATKEVMTKDGYFKTGDIGIVDEEGFLYITGRIKDIIVTAGGKNISPQPIEQILRTSRLIEQIAIIGDNKKFLSALILPDFEELSARLAARGVGSGMNKKDIVKQPEAIALMREEIDSLTASMSRVELIRRFTLMSGEWTIDGGELTASLKIKRNVIQEKYKEVIDKMYLDDEE